MRRATILVLAGVLLGDSLASGQFGGGGDDNGGITHGPILGRPAATEMAVWARTAQPGTFFVHYGLTAYEANSVSDPVVTRVETDNTGWVLLKGLKPDTQYLYRVARGPERTRWGASAAPSARCPLPMTASPSGTQSARTVQLPLRGRLLRQPGRAFARARRCPRTATCCDSCRPGPLRHHQRRLALRGQARLLAGAVAQAGRRTTAGHAARRPARADHHRRVGELQALPDGRQEPGGLAPRRAVASSPSTITRSSTTSWPAARPGKRDRRTVFRDIGLRGLVRLPRLEQPRRVQAGHPLRPGPAQGRQRRADRPRGRLHQARPEAGRQPARPLGHAGRRRQRQQARRRRRRPQRRRLRHRRGALAKHRLRVRPAAEAGRRRRPTRSAAARTTACAWATASSSSSTRARTARCTTSRTRTSRASRCSARRRRNGCMDGMKKSDADFLFVVSSVPFMIPHVGAGGMAVRRETRTMPGPPSSTSASS